MKMYHPVVASQFAFVALTEALYACFHRISSTHAGNVGTGLKMDRFVPDLLLLQLFPWINRFELIKLNELLFVTGGGKSVGT